MLMSCATVAAHDRLVNSRWDASGGTRKESEGSMSSTTKLLVPIPEARRDWLGGIGNTTIYDLINKGELVKVNIGRRAFVTAESLAAFVDRLTEVASA